MRVNVRHVVTIAAATSLYAAAAAGAQGTTPTPAGTSTPAQAPPTGPSLSGTIRGNYHYLLGGPREDFNQFALERVYVTIRGIAAPKLGYRVTTDVFQSGDNNGWTVRMKYAYLDYTFGPDRPWETLVRAGILQTVTIEQQESFWPRWLGPVAIDRHGFFQSADAGVAVQTRLPGKLGEAYAHVVNGTGYVRRETDRFKDVGARLSLTPFGTSGNALLASTTVSGWVYQGATASRFVGDPLAPIGDALERDRWGVHAAMKDPRLTLAVEHSRRTDDVESGENIPTDPRGVASREGAVTAGFAILRPVTIATGRPSPLGLVARYDHVTPDVDGDDFHYLLAGAIYDINRRFAISLNYQEQLGSTAPGPFRGLWANLVVDF